MYTETNLQVSPHALSAEDLLAKHFLTLGTPFYNAPERYALPTPQQVRVLHELVWCADDGDRFFGLGSSKEATAMASKDTAATASKNTTASDDHESNDAILRGAAILRGMMTAQRGPLGGGGREVNVLSFLRAWLLSGKSDAEEPDGSEREGRETEETAGGDEGFAGDRYAERVEQGAEQQAREMRMDAEKTKNLSALVDFLVDRFHGAKFFDHVFAVL